MKKSIIWILSIIFGIIILALILLPGFAKDYIIKHSKEYIGRQVGIDKIRINYFTSTIRVDGFKLYEADEKEVFVSFESLRVNFQPLNLIKNELVIEQLYLQGLYADIIQKDTTFNFDDIIAFLNKPADSAETETDTTPSEPLRFRMYDFQLRQAHFIYDDRNVKEATELRDFSFTIPYIAWNQEDKSEAGIRFSFATEGYFESSLKIDPIGGDFQADVTIDKLHLDTFKKYISYYTNLHSLDGIFSCHIDVFGNINHIEKSIVSGKMGIQDLVIIDTLGVKILGTDKIDIGIKKIDYAHSRYEFDSLVLTGPYVHFILSDSTDNISELFSMPEDSSAMDVTAVDTSSSSSEDSLYYFLNAFIISKGVIDYTDNLTGQPFDYHLSDIVLNTDSISSNAGWVNLYSQMLLNERGTLKADVGFNPLDPVNNITLNYIITNFQLSDLNIYSRFYMGFPIIYGNMYYKSETSITKGQLKSENQLVMTEVEMGDKSGGIYDLPIKFVLFILKDREGVINLDIPVRGDLNDPRLNIRKIVWNTVKNFIVKLAAAPFDALAGFVNADPKELKSIEFDYNYTTLTAQKQHQLELLLELEQKKEGLGIELVYFNDVDKEKALIAEEKNLQETAEIERQSGLFAGARVRVLNDFLHAVNDSTLIRFSTANPADPKNTGSKPVFEVVYSIK